MDGFLLLDKPVGLSSAACVAKVKRKLQIKKIGHTGTLDPFAEGLLPLAIGKATKAIEYLPKEKKVYRATLKLGEETDTLDNEGTVIVRAAVGAPSIARIRQALDELIGPQMQLPPKYSAVKVKGKPLYAYARSGTSGTVTWEPRPIEIDSCRLLDWKSPFIEFEVSCSPGTYMRVVGQDLARRLGTCGHLVRLTRLESDGFSLAQAVPLEQVSPHQLIPVEHALRHLPIVIADEMQAMGLRHGKKRVLPMQADFVSTSIATLFEDHIIAIMGPGEGGYLKIRKVI